jgi:hypothetical protein
MQFIHISWKQKRNKLSSPNLLWNRKPVLGIH